MIHRRHDQQLCLVREGLTKPTLLGYGFGHLEPVFIYGSIFTSYSQGELLSTQVCWRIIRTSCLSPSDDQSHIYEIEPSVQVLV